MNKLYILTALLFITFAAVYPDDSQSNTSYQPSTLFGNGDILVGGYGSVNCQCSYINGAAYLVCGGEGAAIFDHWLIIGGGGKSVANNIPSPIGTELNYGWGGLLLGFIIMPENIIHPYVRALIGAGSISETTNCCLGMNSCNNWAQASFFSLEGEVGLELNVTRWMRIALFGGYHYVYGPINIDGLTDSDFRSYDAGIKFEFGWF
jgi:hypothetical protein